MDSTHKTVLFAILSMLFATDYGITTITAARSISHREQIQATESQNEESEETQRLKLLLTELHPPVKISSYRLPFTSHRVKHHV